MRWLFIRRKIIMNRLIAKLILYIEPGRDNLLKQMGHFELCNIKSPLSDSGNLA
jgi:hypothetical protein